MLLCCQIQYLILVLMKIPTYIQWKYPCLLYKVAKLFLFVLISFTSFDKNLLATKFTDSLCSKSHWVKAIEQEYFEWTIYLVDYIKTILLMNWSILCHLHSQQAHPEGVAQVNFKEVEAADACIQLLNGRWFGQRKITAETWDGKAKYK